MDQICGIGIEPFFGFGGCCHSQDGSAAQVKVFLSSGNTNASPTTFAVSAITLDKPDSMSLNRKTN